MPAATLRRITAPAALCSAVTIFLSGTLHAQTAPSAPPPYRETVVVTGTAAPTTVDDLSRTVRVITREEIARLPVRGVEDLLRLVSSVDVRARGSHGVQSDFGIRGAGFGQVLVLVDGVRYNNLQSGHHNADLPLTLDDVERVEVLLGPGSSIHGADAFGGTINLITRRSESRSARMAVGEFGLVEGRVSAGWAGRIRQHFGFEIDRSSGFMFDRDHRILTFSSRSHLGSHTTISIGHIDKDFGANGFYGNSPSKEWTNQTAAAVHHVLLTTPRADVTLTGSIRAHRDHFRWDIHRPGFAENRHRTLATGGGVAARWKFSDASEVRFGGEGATDRIRSSNLGTHGLHRAGGYVEAQHRVGAATVSGAVRADAYSAFGSAVSPAAGVSWWPQRTWRLRASVGRAFRVPTFTERYYSDPAHAATADLDPERAWTVDAAVDWFSVSTWMLTAGVFDRHEQDVIDWVRPDSLAVWRTTNIHDVRTWGFEAAAKRVNAGPIGASIEYTWLSTDAAPLELLAKYTLDYAPHSLVGSASAALPAGLSVGGRFDLRARTERDPYVLLDLRVSRDLGPLRLFVDVTNLLDARYEEIRGIPMPGRWWSGGIDVLRW
jgi:iron complex outermembrane receptor protein